jgi:hypothetical protein
MKIIIEIKSNGIFNYATLTINKSDIVNKVNNFIIKLNTIVKKYNNENIKNA